MATNNGPYKNEGETVYATEPTENTPSSEEDGPVYKNKEWLYHQYHIFGKSLTDIAEDLEVSTGAIAYQMRKHDIPRRGRNEAASKAQGGDGKLWDGDWLREKYVVEEKSSAEIAELTGNSKTTVLNALHRNDIPVRDYSKSTSIAHGSKYGPEKYNDPNWLEWQYHTLQKSASEIADENGWGVVTVWQALDRHDIRTRSDKAAQLLRRKKEKGDSPNETRSLVSSDGIDASWKNLSDVKSGQHVQYRDKEWLQSQIRRGRGLSEMAEECSCDVAPSTIRRWLKRFDLYSELVDERYKDEEWLHRQYVVNNLAQHEVAEMCDVSQATIHRWLKNHDIPTRDMPEAATLGYSRKD